MEERRNDSCVCKHALMDVGVHRGMDVGRWWCVCMCVCECVCVCGAGGGSTREAYLGHDRRATRSKVVNDGCDAEDNGTVATL